MYIMWQEQQSPLLLHLLTFNVCVEGKTFKKCDLWLIFFRSYFQDDVCTRDLFGDSAPGALRLWFGR